MLTPMMNDIHSILDAELERRLSNVRNSVYAAEFVDSAALPAIVSRMFPVMLGYPHVDDDIHGVAWYRYVLARIGTPAPLPTILEWLRQRPDCVVMHNAATGVLELGVLPR